MIRIAFNSLNNLTLYGRNSQKNGWHHKGKTLPCNLLVLIERGECSFSVGDKQYDLQKNDAIIIPPNTYYVPNTNAECDFAYFWFYGNEANTDNDEFALFLPQVQRVNDDTQEFLNEVLVENNKMKRSIAFYNALISISNNNATKNNGIAQSIRKHLVDNLNEKLSLEEVANHFNYTKQHVIRLFKSCYFVSPLEFVNCERLKKSCELLSQRQDLSVCQIATLCGFVDAGYFSRLFKKEYGVSPKEYRRRNAYGV